MFSICRKLNVFKKKIKAVATNKFTLSNGKYLGIEIREHNGGRHLKMKLRNGHLMRAKALY